jgi:hypothetical protein
MDIVLLEGCNGSDTAGGEESGGVSCRNCPEDVSIAFFVLHCFGVEKRNSSTYMRFGVLTVVTTETAIFWDVTSCSLVEI